MRLNLPFSTSARPTPVARALAALLATLPLLANAQVVPDAGSLLREERREPRTVPPAASEIAPIPASTQAPTAGVRFTVTSFRLQGVTLLPEADLQAVLAPWCNRPIVFADLERAEQAVADAYRARGWLARPQLPQQDLVGGVVTLRVTESRLGEVRIDDDGLSLRFDRGRILLAATARQQPGQPLRLDDLDRAVNLLNDTPGLHASAALAPGTKPGETDLVIKPQDQPAWSGKLTLDDDSPRATGAVRLGVDLALNSPTGIGDQAVLDASSTGAGNAFLSLAYTRPVGNDGWRVGLNGSLMEYRLGQTFAPLGAHGNSGTYGLRATYPLVRSSRRNAALTLSAERSRLLNVAGGVVVSDKRLTDLGVGVDGDASDDLGGYGDTQWGLALTSGRVDLSANAADERADAAGPRSAGRDIRLAWNLARLQQAGRSGAIWLSANGQFADRNLDSAAKFSLGGAHGVRAYPALEGTGDNGWLASAEWRVPVLPGLQWLAFYDQGSVRVNQHADFAGAPARERIDLRGVGMGIHWALFDRASLRAQLAHRLGTNPLADPATGHDSDGSLHALRLWLSLAASL
jgi:hemolysin activation/secretion protein